MKYQYYKLMCNGQNLLDNTILHCSQELADAYAKSWNECKDYYAISEAITVEKITSTSNDNKIMEPDAIAVAIKRLYSDAISMIDKEVEKIVDKRVDQVLGKKLLLEIADYINSKNDK